MRSVRIGTGVLAALLASGCVGATVVPSSMTMPDSSPTPTPSAGESPSLDLDSLVTVRSSVVPVSERPGSPPWRFDTGDPDPSTHPLLGFGEGLILLVVDGPVWADGGEWYLLTPAQLAIDVPTGWSPAHAPDGSGWFTPASIDCPDEPGGAELAELWLTTGVVACYGARDVTITGWLTCRHEPDPSILGPDWFDTGAVCHIDDWVPVYGPPLDLPPGVYAVTGHFDDSRARQCVHADPADTDLAQLEAVLECRRTFVATSWGPGPAGS